MKRRALTAAISAALVATAALVPPATAWTGSSGTAGPSYTSVVAPTADKQQSKTWLHDDVWYAVMYNESSGYWEIFRQDPAGWVSTGALVDHRENARADAHWDGETLRIASHAVASSSATTQRGNPAYLLTYEFDEEDGFTFLDQEIIMWDSTESLTITVDSLGRVWAAWTWEWMARYTYQLPDGTFAPHAIVPDSNAADLDADDVATIVAFDDQIGVMWSDEADEQMWFASRFDSDPAAEWGDPVAVTPRLSLLADDHISLRSVPGDPRVYAAFKTSLARGAEPEIMAAVREADGTWRTGGVFTASECVTRPQLALDEGGERWLVAATAADGACPWSGVPGVIVALSAPLGSLAFGPSELLLRNGERGSLNNVTMPKQTIPADTDVLALASDDAARVYWSGNVALEQTGGEGTATPLVAAFRSHVERTTVNVADTSRGAPEAWLWDFGDGSTSTDQHTAHTYTAPGTYTITLSVYRQGDPIATTQRQVTIAATAPVASFEEVLEGTTVQFHDTSAPEPTTWHWDFGDGATSTQQSPEHTYAQAGTYTVTLTAGNAGGSTSVSRQVTVSQPASPVAVVSSTSNRNVRGNDVIRTDTPAGLAVGDVMIASMVVDDPSAGLTPRLEGWQVLADEVLVDGAAPVGRAVHLMKVATQADVNRARVVVDSDTLTPWAAGVTAYRGVSATDPLTGAPGVVTTQDGVITLTAPPTVAGGLLVSAAAVAESASTPTTPQGWTTTWSQSGANSLTRAHLSPGAAGAAELSWSVGGTAGSALVVGLRPAG